MCTIVLTVFTPSIITVNDIGNKRSFENEKSIRRDVFYLIQRVHRQSLMREYIRRFLRNRGFSEKFVNIIKELYNGFECCMLIL